MKISWFKHDITPEIGTKVSGYAMNDVSFSKWNDLLMTGLLADDGERKVLLVSFDLQCLDVEFIQQYRRECGEILGIPPEAVMLSFTHTHGGPQTNCEAGYSDYLNRPYLDFLRNALLAECRNLVEKPQNIEVDTYFYSTQVDENKNRRVVLADNYDAFIPHRNEFRPLANGFTDQELCSVLFFDADSKGDRFPVYAIGNYAAHPLAAHGPGTAGRRISADFPGPFRDYVTGETGAECMFVSGALGDMIPLKDELGSEAAKEMGIHLGEGLFRSMIDAQRNPDRFKMESPKVGALCRSITVPIRPLHRDNPKRLPDRDLGKKEIELEIQCLAIGDVCFVGVPGEWCAELGQEVKGHSAFRKAAIAFSATAYRNYMCPGNFLLQGGYEADTQQFPARYSIALVKTAVDATYALRDELYPLSEGEEEENYTRTSQFSVQTVKIGRHDGFPEKK